MLYDSKKDEEYFDELAAQMTAGPCLILCLAKVDAIKNWREYLGPAKGAAEEAPESFRARFQSSEINPIHAADSQESVQAERSIIFPDDEDAIALIKPDAFDQAEDIVEHLKKSGFEVKQSKDVTLSKEVASKIYNGKEGEEFFDNLVNHMTEGTCKVLVLADRNSLEKLRATVGPTDPEEAKKVAEESIRANFAKSILENAIHTPSSTENLDMYYELLLS